MSRLEERAVERPVAEQLGELLRKKDRTLAVAESATGGMVGSLVTDVPGSSDYFDRSLVLYSNRSKRQLVDVNPEAIDEHGAVSREVARQMAQGVRDAADTDWGISTTGIAGPGGGTEEKPVGLVFIGVASSGDDAVGRFTETARYVFEGDRWELKERFARQALRDLVTAMEQS